MPKKKLPKQEIGNPKWAVCFNVLYEPVAWGWIEELNSTAAHIVYGEECDYGTGFNKELWINKSIRIFDTEEEAKKVVEDFKKKIIYDPR